jgi:cytoskeleton protein RodZ
MAQRLHLSVSQVEALETGDFGRLAGGPFVKGFVRNYARVLGIDPEPLVSLVLRDVPSVPPPSLAVPNQGIRFDPFGRRLGPATLRAAIAAVALLLLGIGVLYWWLNVYPAAPKPVLVSTPADTRSTELPGVAPPLPAEPAAPAPVVASPSPQPSRAEPPVRAEPRAEPAATTPAGLARVRLLAAERTWVEIVDGAGERVTSRHIEAGAPAEFLGRPPLRVSIGNASATRLNNPGRVVDPPPHTRSAVARLTLE